MSDLEKSFTNLEPTLAAEGSLDDTKPMSKNAIKKAAKAERLAALKLERRAREKEAKKEKKRIRAEKRAAGELDDAEEEEMKRRMKRSKVQLEFGGTVVVDLGFDSMMNDKVRTIIMYDPVFPLHCNLLKSDFFFMSLFFLFFFLDRKLCPCAPSWHTHIALIARPRSRFH